MGWRLATVRVAEVQPSHAVEPDRLARHRRGTRYTNEPICVKRRWFGGYRVHDGNARLALARERGQTRIRAWVQD